MMARDIDVQLPVQFESMLISEETAMKKQSFPLGSVISSTLSSHAVGNLLQVHEFLCRFQEILGVEELWSLEELEMELICPWPDSFDTPKEVVKETIEKNCTRSMGDKLTTVHQALLPELVSACLDEISSDSGNKKDTANGNMAKRIKLDMLPINQLTWPEVVRRCILAYLVMGGRLSTLNIAIRNNKLIRCLLGDGGICCSSPTGVAGVDVDAQLLGRAVHKVFGKLKRKSDTLSIGFTGNKGNGSDEYGLGTDGTIPDWAKELDLVKTLPTNVGSRIRKCIKAALEKNPPEWAMMQLEASIAKDVYKGNACGPTKREVIDVLNRVSDVARTLLPPDREQNRIRELISKIIIKKCRVILRGLLDSDNKVFSDLVGRNFNSDDNDVRVVFGSTSIRPLDLQTIDLRLLHDTYGGSHDTFLEDVRELWINLKISHMNRPSLVELADKLSKDFEKEVATLFDRLFEYNSNRKCTAEVEKELEELLTSLKIPEAPWDTGICRVCGVNKDDDNVLLCDTNGCDAPYHTYCLNPPLSKVPEGHWYCPTCAPHKLLVDNEPQSPRQALQFSKEEADHILDIATAMEETEYWELGADKKTFLLKFLCDELLNTTLIRQNIDRSGEKLLRVRHNLKALRSKEKNLGAKGVEIHRRPCRTGVDVSRGRNHASAPNVDDFVDNYDTDKENCNGSFSDDHLTKQLSRLSVRKELLGIDSVGRLYWGFPDTCTHYGIAVNENVPLENSEISPSDHPLNHSQSGYSSTWCLFQSDEEIRNLVDYLRRNESANIKLRDSILQWQKSMLQGGQRTKRNLVDSRNVSSADLKKSLSCNCVAAKATALIVAKYSSEPDASRSPKKARRKSTTKWHRCVCLEPILPSRYHCIKCHVTFFTSIEFEHHKHSACDQSSVEKSKANPLEFGGEQHKHSANGNPSIVPSGSIPAIDPRVATNSDQGLVLQPGKSGTDQLACSLAKGMIYASSHDGSGMVGRNFAIPESSLKPIVGKAIHILSQLKINLLDMEAALPDGAMRASRARPEWRSAWCAFVKSANTIYEMVEATLVFETMIKTEYIKNTWWWYWSSAAAAAKTSTLSALALRIYTLDAAIDYQKGTTSSPQERSRKRKEVSEKAEKQSKKAKKPEDKQVVKKERSKKAKEPEDKQQIKDVEDQ